MIFPANIGLPVIVPKFVILVMYFEMVGSIEGDFSIKVTHGPKNNLLIEHPVIRKDLEAADATQLVAADLAEDSERIFHIRMPIVLSPFAVEETGRLRVRAHYVDGKILKLGSIAIRQISDSEFQAMSGAPASR
jgi:hypothetical protein